MLRPDEEQILVIIGDGRERYLLEDIAQKFNGKALTLALVSKPLIDEGKKGKAALEGLPSLLHVSYRVEKVLFLIDREHVESKTEIEEELKKYGFIINNSQELAENAWLVEATHGAKTVRIYVAVAGKTKSMNEELEELAKIQATKKGHKVTDIKYMLRSTANIRRLIKSANREDLEKSLKALSYILGYLESSKNCF